MRLPARLRHPDGLALTVTKSFFRITRSNAEIIVENRASVFTTRKRASLVPSLPRPSYEARKGLRYWFPLVEIALYTKFQEDRSLCREILSRNESGFGCFGVQPVGELDS